MSWSETTKNILLIIIKHFSKIDYDYFPDSSSTVL